MNAILIWITGEYVTFLQDEKGCVKFFPSPEAARTAEIELEGEDIEQTRVISLEEVEE